MTAHSYDRESAVLDLAAAPDGRLATIVGITGGFSRALGSQLAVSGDAVAGDLSDHCLEGAIVAELNADSPRRVMRFGAGSDRIDLQLACGGGVDVLIDPAPDHALLSIARDARVTRERAVALALPLDDASAMREVAEGESVGGHFVRLYRPACRLVVLGAGGEAEVLARIAEAAAMQVLRARPIGDELADVPLAMGRAPEGVSIDRWTAILTLFHDHEWERGILPWALQSDAFYVGALGSMKARAMRDSFLASQGYTDDQIASVRGPIGLVPALRTPETIAISILAEVVAVWRERFG